jgi:hypothetical protein
LEQGKTGHLGCEDSTSTENREQGTENRDQRSENREQGSENRDQRSENREQGTGIGTGMP